MATSPETTSAQRPEYHKRSKSSFSFRSRESDKSNSSKPKIDLKETESEKRKAKFTGVTTTNPNRAISEEQPATRALNEEFTLLPIRSIQHKDWQSGSFITDPDASNPSRSRLERPLDTIRSFEAAADGFNRKRSAASGTDVGDNGTTYSSRRSSWVGAYDQYYAANPRLGASTSALDGQRRASYARQAQDAHHRGANYSNMNPRRGGMGSRMSSAPMQMHYGRGHHTPGVSPQRSYENDESAYYNGESSQSEPWTNSTDPSSENSSIDRLNAIRQGEQPQSSGDAYGGGMFAGQYYPYSDSQRNRSSSFQDPIDEEQAWQSNHDGHHDQQAYYSNENVPGRQPFAQQQSHYNYSTNGGPSSPNGKQPRHIMRLNGSSGVSNGDTFQPHSEPGPVPFRQQLAPEAYAQKPLPAPMENASRKLGKKGPPPVEKKLPTAPQEEKRKSWLKRTFSLGRGK